MEVCLKFTKKGKEEFLREERGQEKREGGVN